MPMITYPLNNIEYTAEDAELFHSTRTSGVYANNSFDYSVTGADNNIVIGTGIGWIKNGEFAGKVIAQKEAVSIDMGLPDSVYPRIDAVVIQFDANANGTSIIVKKGAASSNPIAPAVVRNESIYELHLYHVRREPGAIYISPSNITDLRLNKSYCGLMVESVTDVGTDTEDKDSIEEQGTSGIWYYRKWKNGTAECWGKKNYGTVAVSKAWGNVYESDASWAEKFPDSLFVSPPDYMNIHMLSNDDAGAWLRTGPNSELENGTFSATSTGSFGFMRASAHAGMRNMTIGFYAIGRWK